MRILDEALVSGVIAPNSGLITMLFFMGGGFLSLARKVINRVVETVDQLRVLGLPAYATVPLSEERAS